MKKISEGALNLHHLCSHGYNPKEWEEIPIIKEARPVKKGFVEVSLQRLEMQKGINIVYWMGAKNGKWYPASEFFIVKKRFASYYSPSKKKN